MTARRRACSNPRPLALGAAGIGVVKLLPPLAVPFAREAFGIVLLVLGTVVAATSYRRWRETERAMRSAELPHHALPGVLAVSISMLAARSPRRWSSSAPRRGGG